jgi:hypothetical protein
MMSVPDSSPSHSKSGGSSSSSDLLIDEMVSEWGYLEIVADHPDGQVFRAYDNQIVFKVIKNLGKQVNSDGNEVCVPAIHHIWADLGSTQKMKTYRVWRAILSDPYGKEKIFTHVRNYMATLEAEKVSKSGRSPNITANEWYRLALLMDFEGSQQMWSVTKYPLDRQGLDARQSGDVEVSDAADPWKALAVMFNDPDQPFRNIACKYNEDGVLLREMADPCLSDGGTNLCSFEDIWKRVRDLDPKIFSTRDGDWIKDKSQAIRSFLNKYAGEKVGFFKSGDQDAENILSAWSFFCRDGGHPVWADALILTPSGMCQL